MHLIEIMAEIQKNSKRYGPDQRALLTSLFRILLQNIDKSDNFDQFVIEAYDKFS